MQNPSLSGDDGASTVGSEDVPLSTAAEGLLGIFNAARDSVTSGRLIDVAKAYKGELSKVRREIEGLEKQHPTVATDAKLLQAKLEKAFAAETEQMIRARDFVTLVEDILLDFLDAVEAGSDRLAMQHMKLLTKLAAERSGTAKLQLEAAKELTKDIEHAKLRYEQSSLQHTVSKQCSIGGAAASGALGTAAGYVSLPAILAEATTATAATAGAAGEAAMAVTTAEFVQAAFVAGAGTTGLLLVCGFALGAGCLYLSRQAYNSSCAAADSEMMGNVAGQVALLAGEQENFWDSLSRCAGGMAEKLQYMQEAHAAAAGGQSGATGARRAPTRGMKRALSQAVKEISLFLESLDEGIVYSVCEQPDTGLKQKALTLFDEARFEEVRRRLCLEA